MLDRIVNIQGNQQDAINKLIEGQLAGQVLQGQLAEQTMQLKKAVDYLLSNDGGGTEA